MVRTKKMKRSAHAPSQSPQQSKPPPSIPALLSKAQDLMGEMDFELARRFVERILILEPTHFEAREMLGIIEAEEGNVDVARALFASLVHPSPTARPPPSHSAYLYLAQLTDSDPREALAHYQAAVDQLIVLVKGKERIRTTTSENAVDDPANPDPDSEAGLKRTAVSALVAMVEIWMTSDLCMEPEAEEQCDKLISLAISTDPENVEALDSLASVRLSQSRNEEAEQIVHKAWTITSTLEPDDPHHPPLQSLLSLARRSLELSLFTQALSILQRIMASDDEEIDAWYLQGWCFFLMAQKAKETGEAFGEEKLGWEDLARDSRDCLEACSNFYIQGEHDDPELISHVKELIQQLEEAGVKPSLDVEGDADDGEEVGEWEDEDEDGDDDGEGGDVEMG